MTENIFFLDSEHVGMGGMFRPKFTTFIEQVQVVEISPTKNIPVFRYAT